jgi:ABC-type multidrug transport system fused ATPase/permease subunit
MNPAIRSLFSYAKPYKKEWTIALVSMIAYAFFTSRLTLLVKQILDDVLIQTKPDALLHVSFLLLFFYLGKGVASFYSSYSMTSIGLKVVRSLRDQLYKRIIYQSLAFFSSQKTGDLTARVISDTERIQDAVSKTLTDLIKESFTDCYLLFFTWTGNWPFFLLFCFLWWFIPSRASLADSEAPAEWHRKISVDCHKFFLKQFPVHELSRHIKWKTERLKNSPTKVKNFFSKDSMQPALFHSPPLLWKC